MDHDSLDASLQRGSLRKPGRDLCKGKSRRRDHLLSAQALADKVLGECSYEVLETYKGKDLEYKEYEPLYNFKELKKKAYYVVCEYLCNHE